MQLQKDMTTENTKGNTMNDQNQNSDQTLLQKFRNDQDGSGFVEKIIIIALFCFVVMAGMKLLGTSVSEKLENQGNGINKIKATDQNGDKL